LAVSFKEVEWAKFSRVDVVEDEEKVKLVEKYEKLVENYEKWFQETQKEQTRVKNLRCRCLHDIRDVFRRNFIIQPSNNPKTCIIQYNIHMFKRSTLGYSHHL
jgi:hypothetical protein